MSKVSRQARSGGWALVLVAVLGACDDAPPAPAATSTAANPGLPAAITLSDARVQLPVVPGRPGAAYVAVTLAGGQPRTLAAVRVAAAGRAEMHTSRKEEGVVRMVPLQQARIEPGQTLRFAPGGAHIMLFDIDPELAPGTTTELTATFADGDTATIAAPVVAAGGEAMH